MMKRMIVTMAAATATSLVLAASPADPPAGAAPATAGKRFAKLDSNGDGVISRTEAQAAPKLAAKFDAVDSNKDGVLTREEFAAWRKAHPKSAAVAPAVKP